MGGKRSQRIIACVPLGIQPVVPAGEAETAVINLHGALTGIIHMERRIKP